MFPLFKLRPEEITAIYAILNRYPEVMDKKFELRMKIFGITVHPSARVRGVVENLIGANPLPPA